jgi:hypothetical protein
MFYVNLTVYKFNVISLCFYVLHYKHNRIVHRNCKLNIDTSTPASQIRTAFILVIIINVYKRGITTFI